MKFQDLLALVGKMPYFDLPTLVQLTREKRQSLRVQLYRWTKSGKLISLRRSMYAFAEPYRRVEINPAALANALYRPSYLSCQWALSYCDIIPEAVFVHTSVSTRVARSFRNALSDFNYRHIKADAFFGYKPVVDERENVLVGEPEKALLDLWHLHEGEWDINRMVEMRFQNFEMVDCKTLELYARAFKSPRLLRAVDVFVRLSKLEFEDSIEL